jgi:hypothetical protein
MKTVPIEKRCKVCEQQKLLVEFEIDERLNDRHENICKDCRMPVEVCTNRLDFQVVQAMEPMIDLLLNLVRSGTPLPDNLMDKLVDLVHLAGLQCYCENCHQKIFKEYQGFFPKSKPKG